ncbi:hypothetical protein [Lysinibacter sp. HNR]|uniref:hypothetical protein n=1 Tax=Lysinibacter sp. HNR TaxID=3031408 RepID=UPI0024351880|nr:hypothetical protein [Lysinibacter sp. HNR]WGD38074.1 hypothetical protein FrondiHNR_03920 [Lysinibacter sp. HNR]
MIRASLYIHVKNAGHFLRWELPEFARYFDLVDAPRSDALLLSFGPDALDEAARLPALRRFAVLFPGFSYNPVRNIELREHQISIIEEFFDEVFINPGPLEIAYSGLQKVSLYPFSIDLELINFTGPRQRLDSLLHVSHDNPQKDWQRSESVMKKTGLKYEVFPPRNPQDYEELERSEMLSRVSGRRWRRNKPFSQGDAPSHAGYLSHTLTMKKYAEYDGFVHIATDVQHPEFIDGKYTASLMEAGATGSLIFWHDTWQLGNGLETVFALPSNTTEAAREILEIRKSINVVERSLATREEMLDVFNPQSSVRIRANQMMDHLS